MKEALRSLVKSLGRSTTFWVVLQARPIRHVLREKLGFEGLYRMAVSRPHPYDVANGTDTGGVASSTGTKADHPYWGASPSVVRAILAKIPALERFTFIDLGCGKGRPLLIASEYPFRTIVGVELSTALAQVGQENAAIMARQHPGRTPIEVIAGDATAYHLPPGDILLYLYNPFGEELMKKVVAEVERALAAVPRTIFVVYQNPVSGRVFDASPVFKRYYAANISYKWEERGFRWDTSDTMDAVVIWSGGREQAAPLPGANAEIETIKLVHASRAHIAG